MDSQLRFPHCLPTELFDAIVVLLPPPAVLALACCDQSCLEACQDQLARGRQFWHAYGFQLRPHDPQAAGVPLTLNRIMVRALARQLQRDRALAAVIKAVQLVFSYELSPRQEDYFLEQGAGREVDVTVHELRHLEPASWTGTDLLHSYWSEATDRGASERLAPLVLHSLPFLHSLTIHTSELMQGGFRWMLIGCVNASTAADARQFQFPTIKYLHVTSTQIHGTFNGTPLSVEALVLFPNLRVFQCDVRLFAAIRTEAGQDHRLSDRFPRKLAYINKRTGSNGGAICFLSQHCDHLELLHITDELDGAELCQLVRNPAMYQRLVSFELGLRSFFLVHRPKFFIPIMSQLRNFSYLRELRVNCAQVPSPHPQHEKPLNSIKKTLWFPEFIEFIDIRLHHGPDRGTHGPCDWREYYIVRYFFGGFQVERYPRLTEMRVSLHRMETREPSSSNLYRGWMRKALEDEAVSVQEISKARFEAERQGVRLAQLLRLAAGPPDHALYFLLLRQDGTSASLPPRIPICKEAYQTRAWVYD